MEAFHSRSRNNILDISGIRGYGLRSIRDFGFRRIEIDYTYESYESSSKVKRSIYGGVFTRNMHKGLEYSAFGYKMKGKKGSEKFDGYALGIYGKFEGVIDPIGKGGAWIRYILGSGDELDDESGFLPVLSSVESDILGEFYARNREFRYIDGTLSSSISMNHSIANLSILRNALYATVRDDISVFMIRSTFKKHQPSVPLGGSLTLGVIYNYRFIQFQAAYTNFKPETAYDAYIGDKATKFYTLGLSSRF